ncbi:MAG: hypothetical protein B6I36_09465 [Desulfobacteraceae bacterium 4572_35.1]|nr:MAG: hypothetical protein B6I36_09465 [Desulfobacteraceae bacterium 4572_35.1]
MWYSSVKVGIVEIDMDHYNIDTMLQLYSSDRVPESYLPQIISALIKHFDTEEGIIDRMGHEFPQEHKDEHANLTKVLEAKLTNWQAGDLDGKDFVEEVRQLLLLHVAEYDVLLGDGDIV